MRRPRAGDDERQRPLHDNGENYERVNTSGDVFEEDRDTWTGLYDADGRKLHRPRETIGYKIR